jgi:hypothetical protein
MFQGKDEILAGDENLSQETVAQIVDAFEHIAEYDAVLGRVKGITIKCVSGVANVSNADDIYLVTTASNNVDIAYLNTITRVMFPTVLKLLEKTQSTSTTQLTEKVVEPPQLTKPLEKPVKETGLKPPNEMKLKPKESTLNLPEKALNVENMSGLQVKSDVARVDQKLLSEWQKEFAVEKIESIEIQTPNGKTLQCNVKPIMKLPFIAAQSKMNVIQISRKTQATLEIRKGDEVKVKPLIT